MVKETINDWQNPDKCEHPDCTRYADQRFLGRQLCGDHYTERLDQRFAPDAREEFIQFRAEAAARHAPYY